MATILQLAEVPGGLGLAPFAEGYSPVLSRLVSARRENRNFATAS